MGMLAVLLIVVLSLAFVVVYKQKLTIGKHDSQESFMALKIALSCRHQAVRHVLDASQLYLLNAAGLNEKTQQACEEAENALSLAVRFASKESLGRLCKAETRLNGQLRELQNHLKEELKHRSDEKLGSRLEMLDAAESDVIHSRRAYNRSAERYNRLLKKPPMAKCAHVLGHKDSAGLVKFEDNSVAQMSRHLMV